MGDKMLSVVVSIFHLGYMAFSVLCEYDRVLMLMMGFFGHVSLPLFLCKFWPFTY